MGNTIQLSPEKRPIQIPGFLPIPFWRTTFRSPASTTRRRVPADVISYAKFVCGSPAVIQQKDKAFRNTTQLVVMVSRVLWVAPVNSSPKIAMSPGLCYANQGSGENAAGRSLQLTQERATTVNFQTLKKQRLFRIQAESKGQRKMWKTARK